METVEIRKLESKALCDVAALLSINEDWKKVMSIVKVDDNDNKYRFNNNHILLIEQASKVQRRDCAEIFLEEWSTMGKKRPTLQILLQLVIEAQLFRIADYINDNILNRGPAERPTSGPAARVDNLTEMFANSDDETDEKIPEDKNSTKKISNDKNNKEKKALPKVVRTNTEYTDFNNKSTKRIDDLSNVEDDKTVISKSSDLIKFSISEPEECQKSHTIKLSFTEPKSESANNGPKIPVFINESMFSYSEKENNSSYSIDNNDTTNSENIVKNNETQNHNLKTNNLNIPAFLSSNLNSELL